MRNQILGVSLVLRPFVGAPFSQFGGMTKDTTSNAIGRRRRHVKLFGAGGETRTHDLGIMRPSLYP
jgi:hypothetical protein